MVLVLPPLINGMMRLPLRSKTKRFFIPSKFKSISESWHEFKPPLQALGMFGLFLTRCWIGWLDRLRLAYYGTKNKQQKNKYFIHQNTNIVFVENP